MNFIPMRRPAAVALYCIFAISNLGPAVSGRLDNTVNAAETGEINKLKLSTEKVVVFKDGYCLVVKRGSAVTNDSGEIFMNQIPDAAVLGSFWATPKEGRLISMVAGWIETTKEVKKEIACTQTIEIIHANLGKKCSVQLADKSFLSGKITSVLTQPSSTQLSDAQRVSFGLPAVTVARPQLSAIAPRIQSETISGVVGNQFVVRTDEGDVLVPATGIQRLTIDGMKTTLPRTITTKEKAKRLTFRFAEAGKKREMLIMYFRPGVRWIPTYRINLTENEKKEKLAKISMQAEILNEAEDLEGMPMDIVVGVPNFRFRTNVSPLVLENTLRHTLAQAAPNLRGQFGNDFSNALYSQRSAEFRRDAAQANNNEEGGSVQLPNELTASGTQDLFVYSLPKLNLKKGERAAVPVLTTEVPYRDVYTWELHVKRSDIATAPSGGGVQSPLTLSNNKVWHQIELTNNTKLPWTTGAALIMRDQQPLAQELLTYTSPKDYCRVPVTVSVDTRGSFSEDEIERELKALTWSGYQYAKIHERAFLHLCNNKTETINAEITFRFGGKADKVSDDGKLTLTPYRAEDWQNYRGHPSVNNSSVVFWKVTLKPGETFEPTVDYHFFTRH